MNNIWSEHIQGIKTLYLSRKLRFDDAFFDQYDRLFHLDHDRELKILEIGCGPGALAESLHSWYPGAQITAIDRDSSFITFAQENIAGVNFIEVTPHIFHLRMALLMLLFPIPFRNISSLQHFGESKDGY